MKRRLFVERCLFSIRITKKIQPNNNSSSNQQLKQLPKFGFSSLAKMTMCMWYFIGPE